MLTNLIFPRRCPICDDFTGDRLICKRCRMVPRTVTDPRCIKCGKHIEDDSVQYCADCRINKKNFVAGVALYEYDSVSDSINRFKNGGRTEYSEFYTKEIIRKYKDVLRSYNADALVPIPLSAAKEKRRGYNQAELLAQGLSGSLSIPVRNDILIRVGRTKEQKKLTHEERQNNLVGSFHMAENDVKLKTIILVDDVYTTGSTMNEAARILLTGGVERVYFVTLAIGIGNS